MLSFGFGLVSILGMAILPLLYLGGRLFRSASAWTNREEPPKDRVIPKIILSALIGLAIGCLIQPKWEIFEYCQDTNQVIGQCFFKSLQTATQSAN
jgi:hypothetical protein